jgi:hypothetical protein
MLTTEAARVPCMAFVAWRSAAPCGILHHLRDVYCKRRGELRGGADKWRGSVTIDTTSTEEHGRPSLARHHEDAITSSLGAAEK